MATFKGYTKSSGYKATKADLGPAKSKALKNKMGYGTDTSPHGASSLKTGYYFDTKKQEVKKRK